MTNKEVKVEIRMFTNHQPVATAQPVVEEVKVEVVEAPVKAKKKAKE